MTCHSKKFHDKIARMVSLGVVSPAHLAHRIHQANAKVVHVTIGAGSVKKQYFPLFLEKLAQQLENQGRVFPFQRRIEHICIDGVPGENSLKKILGKKGWEKKEESVFQNEKDRITFVDGYFDYKSGEAASLALSIKRALEKTVLFFFGSHIGDYDIPLSIRLCWNEIAQHPRRDHFRFIVQCGRGDWKMFLPGVLLDPLFDEDAYEYLRQEGITDQTTDAELYEKWKSFSGYAGTFEEFLQSEDYGKIELLRKKYPRLDWVPPYRAFLPPTICESRDEEDEKKPCVCHCLSFDYVIEGETESLRLREVPFSSDSDEKKE